MKPRLDEKDRRRLTATGSPSLCTRCAAWGRTCCQGREIYITLGDRRRIRTVTGDLDFTVWRPPADRSYADQSDDPVWRRHVFRADGSRRTLRNQSNGNCIFLGYRGCRLTIGARPLVCRLHPFTYTADRLNDEPDNDCPRHLLADGELIFDATGTPRAAAVDWHRQLYAELAADRHEDGAGPV